MVGDGVMGGFRSAPVKDDVHTAERREDGVRTRMGVAECDRGRRGLCADRQTKDGSEGKRRRSKARDREGRRTGDAKRERGGDADAGTRNEK